MALNGAVTITPHIDEAFRLSDYGIPSFSDPAEFAADLCDMLENSEVRNARRQAATHYARDVLTETSYIEFWRIIMDELQMNKANQ
ncbi:hypothetical protein MXAZACID_03073 [Acidocella sp. MX-AZ02]|nr:hypothetical protein MXAZACID_03073 [Acidocella sp. MX-AZ02]